MKITSRKLWAAGVFLALAPLAAQSASAQTTKSSGDLARGAVATPAPNPKADPDFASTLAGELGISRSAAAATLASQNRALETATKLGKKFGGAYVDGKGTLVVGVTGAKSDWKATTGVRTRLVKNSWSRLGSIKTSLDRHAGATGTSWGLDARANKVVITVGSDADAAKTASLLKAARRFGSAVRIDRIAGKIATTSPVLAGYPIWTASSGGGRCSAGFNVRYGSANYILSAGHCTAGYPYWYNYDRSWIGPSVSSYFPGRDHGLIRNYYATPYPGVYLWNGTYMPTRYTAWAYAGLNSCKSGSTTYLTCGQVLRTGVTVNYSGQVVYGLDETNICVERGDSGGAHFTGNYALGLTSGSALRTDGHCIGGTSSRSWFQPVIPAMSYYGVGLL